MVIAGTIGIKYFNNYFFQETVDLLNVQSDFRPINFIWTESTYGKYVEKHDAIRIPARIDGIKNKLAKLSKTKI